MPDVLLIRHGQTEWNLARRLQGRHDSPLTVLGERQLAKVSCLARCYPFTRVFSSPAGRARLTAAAIARACDRRVTIEEALWEISFGACSGMREDDVEQHFPGFSEMRRRDKWHTRWPKGESYADVAKRVQPWIRKLWRRAPAGPVAVVAHQGLNRVLLHLLSGLAVEHVLGFTQPPELVLRWHDDRVSHLRLPADLVQASDEALRRDCGPAGAGWCSGLPA